MNAQVRTLKADITASLRVIADIFARLDSHRVELAARDAWFTRRGPGARA